ncbi:hypothetical protein CN918_31915 [Priestia megaterium]|nr:hypothetical protein CN918_31915 [Priestia megaterium]
MPENFPLFNNHLNLSTEELYQYILLFPHHEVLFSKSTSPLYSYHRYSDGLMLKLSWISIKDVTFLSSKKEKHASGIKELVEEEYLTLKEAKIFYFSDVKSNPPTQTYEQFQSLLESKQRKLPQTDYKSLEYPIFVPTIFDESIFTELVEQNQNIIKFKHYLAERGIKDNEYN